MSPTAGTDAGTLWLRAVVFLPAAAVAALLIVRYAGWRWRRPLALGARP